MKHFSIDAMDKHTEMEGALYKRTSMVSETSGYRVDRPLEARAHPSQIFFLHSAILKRHCVLYKKLCISCSLGCLNSSKPLESTCNRTFTRMRPCLFLTEYKKKHHINMVSNIELV